MTLKNEWPYFRVALSLAFATAWCATAAFRIPFWVFFFTAFLISSWPAKGTDAYQALYQPLKKWNIFACIGLLVAWLVFRIYDRADGVVDLVVPDPWYPIFWLLAWLAIAWRLLQPEELRRMGVKESVDSEPILRK